MKGTTQNQLKSFQAGIDAAVLGFCSWVSSATPRNARMRGAYQLASNRLAVLQTYGQALFERRCQMKREIRNFARHCQDVDDLIGTEKSELLPLLEDLSSQEQQITSQVSQIASIRSHLESCMIDQQSEIAQINQKLADLSRPTIVHYVDHTEEVSAWRQRVRDVDSQIENVSIAVREFAQTKRESRTVADIQQKVSEDAARLRILRDAAQNVREKATSMNQVIDMKAQIITTLRSGLSELTSLRKRRTDLLHDRRQLEEQRQQADQRRNADQQVLAALESELGRIDNEAARFDSHACEELLARVEEERRRTRDELEKPANYISERLGRELEEFAETEKQENSNKMQQMADECHEMRNENMKLQAQINEIMTGRHRGHSSRHHTSAESSHDRPHGESSHHRNHDECSRRHAEPARHHSPIGSLHRHAESVRRGSPAAGDLIPSCSYHESAERHGCRQPSHFWTGPCDVRGESRDCRGVGSSVGRLRDSIRELLPRIEVLERAVRCRRATVRLKCNEIEQMIAGVRMRFYLADPDESEALAVPFHELRGRVLALRCHRRGLKKVMKCFRRESGSSMGRRGLVEWSELIDNLFAETKDHLTLARVYQFLG
jgi:chromosome segregation ATPase